MPGKLRVHVKSFQQRLLYVILGVGLMGSLAAIIAVYCIGPNHEQIAESLRKQAFNTGARHEYARAEQIYQSAISEAESSDNGLTLPTILTELSDLYVQEGKLANAQRCLERAIEQYEKPMTASISNGEAARKWKDEDKKGYAIATARLANVLRDQGNYTGAEPLYKQALERADDSLVNVSDKSKLYQDYAQLLHKLGRDAEASRLKNLVSASDFDIADWDMQYPKAEQLLAQGKAEEAHALIVLLRTAAGNFGPKNYRLGPSLQISGIDFLVQNHPKEAEDAFRQAVDVLQRFDQPPDVVLKNRCGLAFALELVGKDRDAQSEYQRCLASNHAKTIIHLNEFNRLFQAAKESELLRKCSNRIVSLAPPSEHVADTAVALCCMADAYRALDLLDKAADRYDQAVSIEEKLISPDRARSSLSMLESLFDCYVKAQQYERAEQVKQKTLVFCEKNFGKNSNEMASNLDAYFWLEYNHANYSRASEVAEKLLLVRNKLGDPIQVAGVYNGMALCCLRANKQEEAVRLLQEQVDIYDKFPQRPQSTLAIVLIQLADALQGVNKMDRAEPLYKRSLSLFESASTPDKASLAVCLNHYACLLRRTNRVEQAIKLESKAKQLDPKAP